MQAAGPGGAPRRSGTLKSAKITENHPKQVKTPPGNLVILVGYVGYVGAYIIALLERSFSPPEHENQWNSRKINGNHGKS